MLITATHHIQVMVATRICFTALRNTNRTKDGQRNPISVHHAGCGPTQLTQPSRLRCVIVIPISVEKNETSDPVASSSLRSWVAQQLRLPSSFGNSVWTTIQVARLCSDSISHRPPTKTFPVTSPPHSRNQWQPKNHDQNRQYV